MSKAEEYFAAMREQVEDRIDASWAELVGGLSDELRNNKDGVDGALKIFRSGYIAGMEDVAGNMNNLYSIMRREAE
jgi:hypothetical protein